MDLLKVRAQIVAMQPHLQTSQAASIVTVSDNMPLKAKSVETKIEPVQDLHGYDRPWEGGKEKNKFDSSSPYNFDEKTIVFGDTAQYIYNTYLEAKTYTISVDGVTAYVYCRLQGTTSNIMIKGKNASSETFVVETSGMYAIWLYNNTDTIDASNVNYVQIEEGSIATSFSPYSNICPISGWTGAEIIKTGKNLLSVDTISLSKPDNRTININLTTPIPPGTYIFSWNSIADAATTILFHNKIIGESGSVAQASASIRNSGAIMVTFSDWVRRIYAYITTSAEDGSTAIISNMQLELNSSATSYQPYAGTLFNIDWTTEAGTIYGGTLDIVTGMLNVTHEQIASYNGEALLGKWISDRDIYNESSTPTIGAQIVYELATPISYQLTPHQIAMLRGNNTFWSNTGDISLSYWAR